MQVIKIRAKFTGRDGSCGFRNGKDYTLEVRKVNESSAKNSQVTIHAVDTTDDMDADPIYDSAMGFLINWDNITHL